MRPLMWGVTFKEKTFQKPGDIFLSRYQNKDLFRAHQVPQSCPQMTDRNSCKEAGWVPGTTGPHASRLHAHKRVLQPSTNTSEPKHSHPSTATSEIVQIHICGNNSHMLGDHVALQWTDFLKATPACLEVHRYQRKEIKTSSANAKLRWKETSHGNSNCSNCYHFVRLATLLIMYFSSCGRVPLREPSITTTAATRLYHLYHPFVTFHTQVVGTFIWLLICNSLCCMTKSQALNYIWYMQS